MEHLRKSSIKCHGFLLDLTSPKVMGIINISPESFFKGSTSGTEKEIIENANRMILDGASIIDIGAVSTRPGANEISLEEEKQRISFALKVIRQNFPDTILSVDTYQSEIAKMAVNEFGVSIINDISAGNFDDNMFQTVAQLNVAYIMMHIQGTPQMMQKNPVYDNIIQDIIQIFAKKIYDLTLLGVSDIIIDPGFGFGKTLEHNYQLLKNLKDFSLFRLPIMVGVSRKSMIYNLLNISPDNALNGTTVCNTIALLNGANILRVHDVQEAVQAIKIFNKLLK